MYSDVVYLANMTRDKSIKLVEATIKGLQEKKAIDIVTINLTKIENTLCKYFVICNGTSNTHVDALTDSVIETVVKTCDDKPIHVEGKGNSLWVLIDYADVIVHIFQKDQRNLYQLEDLWIDAEATNINEH